MNTSDRNQTVSNATYSTHIGSVTGGQVHTGSGNILVNQLTADNKIATKEDFLALLQQLKTDLAHVRKQGGSEDMVDDALTECEAAEREVKKEQPQSERILKRLENAKTVLMAGAGVAVATAHTISAVHKLLPLLEKAIQAVTKLF